MTDETKAKEIFLDVLEEPAERREEVLRTACAGDPDLRARVQRLLDANELAEERLTVSFPLDLLPGAQLGPFRLIEPIGEGGFGVVWRARQDEPVKREVAVKVLRYGVERDSAALRFRLERQALATLDHPGIASVLDGGTERGRPWFAMELVDGHEITRYAELVRPDLRELLVLFLDVCRAIQHAHQRGIIHRDIKPSNVLVRRVDGRPAVKVIDFGIALIEASDAEDRSRRTLTGQVLGTPSYMSPEQLVDTRDVDTRSDVYSLGVLLYELLAGAPPFDAGWLRERGPSEALRVLREQDPPRPSLCSSAVGQTARARELRGELDWIVMRCLEKDRERRYASVAELIADVENHLAGRPVSVGPPSRLYRARKFARRHALGLTALVAVLVSLAGGATWALSEMQRARRAERAEADAASQARLETERFQSIAEFLEHVLLSIDPAFTGGRDVSLLADILDRAATGIADRGDRPPEVEASLRRIIGGAYAAIARFDPAIAQLERGFELRLEALGPEDEATVRLQGELGGVLAQAGELARAEAPLGEALERARQLFGDEDPFTDELLSNFATLVRMLGRLTEATELLEELEARRIRELGREHEDTLLATNNLALALGDLGRFEEAVERLSFLMEVQVERYGERHPRALAAISNYASILDDVGRIEEAEELTRQVLELKLAVLERSHPSVLVTQNNLASLLADTERYREAIALVDEALPHVRPGTDPHARLLSNRGDWRRRAGRVDEALTDARAAVEIAEKSTGAGSLLTLTCKRRLADALFDAGHPAEAEPIARMLVEHFTAEPGLRPEYRANAALRLGVCIAALGRADEARELIEQALGQAKDEEWRARGRATLAELGGAAEAAEEERDERSER